MVTASVYPIGLGPSNVRHIDQQFMHCPPLQFVRELVQNAVEAVTRRKTHNKSKGFMNLVNIFAIKWNGVKKMCFADTGDSMNRSAIMAYMGALGQGAANDGNFGIGAKISTIPMNKYGVIYVCFQGDKTPVTIQHFRRTMLNNQEVYAGTDFDLKRYYDAVGTSSNTPVAECIRNNNYYGTMVILLGNSADQDTTINPEIALGIKKERGFANEEAGEENIAARDGSGKMHWVTRYLNQRYFAIQGAKVTVYPETYEKNCKRNAISVFGLSRFSLGFDDEKRGYKDTVAKSGSVRLSGGIVNWYLLRDGRRKVRACETYEVTGHIAIGCKNEVYSYRAGHAWTTTSRLYGITCDTPNIVLHIFPNNMKASLTRNGLVDDLGRPYNLDAMAAEFSVKMPKELKDHLKAKREKNSASGFAKREDRIYEHAVRVLKNFGGGVLKLVGSFGSGGKVVRKNEPSTDTDEDKEPKEPPVDELPPHTPKTLIKVGRGPKHGEALMRGLVEVDVQLTDDYTSGSLFVEFYADPVNPFCWIRQRHPDYKKIMDVLIKEHADIAPLVLEERLVAFMKRRIFEAYIIALCEKNSECIEKGINDPVVLFQKVAARLNPVLSDFFALNPQTTIDVMMTSLMVAEQEAKRDLERCVKAEVGAA